MLNPFAVSWEAQHQYFMLLFGIFWLALALIGTFTGKTLTRFHGVIRKTEKGFWGWVIFYYLGGIFFIGDFLYKANWLPSGISLIGDFLYNWLPK